MESPSGAWATSGTPSGSCRAPEGLRAKLMSSARKRCRQREALRRRASLPAPNFRDPRRERLPRVTRAREYGGLGRTEWPHDVCETLARYGCASTACDVITWRRGPHLLRPTPELATSTAAVWGVQDRHVSFPTPIPLHSGTRSNSEGRALQRRYTVNKKPLDHPGASPTSVVQTRARTSRARRLSLFG